MSKSVDETVFDYFNLLLTESDPAAQTTPTGSRDNTAAPIEAEPKMVVISRPETSAEQYPAAQKTPTLDRNALEQLLAPVFKEAVAETKAAEVATETPLKTVNKLEPQVEAIAGQLNVQTDAAVSEQAQSQEPTEPERQEAVQLETQVGAPAVPLEPLKAQLEDEFQVLFFKVAGLTLAVPLISLGGIVRIERINHIFGRPSWFMGVQGYRDSQLNIVDTCAWVMPEKYDDKLAQSVNYQYLVVLENSNWGLACESLVNAVKIDKSQVNWRGSQGKRPWLAGVVKEQMCGILHVQALIEMLNAGLGCQDPID
ncbi:chemotaxis protein CheW [Shewanella sp. SE1]|uniref:chemotaxis protein CheW n=1 Tax=Shewanella sp. SE1 TaxID=2705014 RepID=UPI00138F4FAE|nr:chemotaxis protein CheW [Shewanella sp. SE1]NDO75573.1 chemotaxis protein CheW [Shewanella sp. SE1]